MTPRRVLITGAGGFLGGHLWRALAADGCEVDACVSAPPSGPAAGRVHVLRLPDAGLEALVAGARPDWVIHCAGGASVPASYADPAADFRDNVEATQALLGALARSGLRPRVLFLSSAAVYGDASRQPIPESAPLRPLSPYGAHKLQAEELCRRYAASHGLEVLAARAFSIYGPGLRKQVPWDVFRQHRARGRVQLDGSGEERRDFLYVDDFVAAARRLLEAAAFDGSAVNVGSGRDVSVRELAAQLVEHLGGGALAFSGRARAGDPRRYCADTARLRALGFEPRVGLRDGLARYADWLKGVP